VVNTPETPVAKVNCPAFPVIVVPETRPKSPEIALRNVAFTVLPVSVAPDTCVVKTPETPVTLLSNIVFPVMVSPDMR
jgi:hypothetical protein